MNSNELNQPKINDRRQFPRYLISLKIEFLRKGQTDWIRCLSRDLSLGGTCIQTHQNLDLEEELHLKIYLSENEVIDIPQAQVVHQYLSDPLWCMGVQFYQIEENQVKKLDQYLKQKISEITA